MASVPIEAHIAAPVKSHDWSTTILLVGQAFIVFSSATMNANFAQSHNILEPWVAWLLAIGYEILYLYGLSRAAVASRWSIAVQIVAFATALSGGVLYCLGRYGVIPEAPGPGVSIGLSIAHVLPISLLCLFSALAHRASTRAALEEAEAEAETQRGVAEAEERRNAAQRDRRNALALEAERSRSALAIEAERSRLDQQLAIERDQAKLEQWRQAQLYRAELRRNQEAQPEQPGGATSNHRGATGATGHHRRRSILQQKGGNSATRHITSSSRKADRQRARGRNKLMRRIHVGNV